MIEVPKSIQTRCMHAGKGRGIVEEDCNIAVALFSMIVVGLWDIISVSCDFLYIQYE